VVVATDELTVPDDEVAHGRVHAGRVGVVEIPLELRVTRRIESRTDMSTSSMLQRPFCVGRDLNTGV